MEKDAKTLALHSKDKRNYNEIQAKFLKTLPNLVTLLHLYVENVTKGENRMYDINSEWYDDVCLEFLSAYNKISYNEKNFADIQNHFMIQEQEKIRVTYENIITHRKKLIPKERTFIPRQNKDNTKKDIFTIRKPSSQACENQREAFFNIINK